MSKSAPHHNESDLIGTKCWEGCGRGIKIRTVPQWERSDTPKVTRGLGEHMLGNEHRKCQKQHFTRSQPLFCRRLQVLRLPREMIRRYPKCCTATWKCQHVHKQKWRQFPKMRRLTLSKRRPSSPNTVPATKNYLQNQLSFWPTPANVLATCRKRHACHTDEKVSRLHLSRETTF